MGLSCGNPTAIAPLLPGEVVVDLGSGGGFDVFIAAQKVGPSGRVIGIDMTPDMLSKARRNVATFRERTGLDNAEFRLGEIEHLPLADRSVDVIISNCVINLSPEKQQIWHEIARVLKPGGRVAGAVLVEETEAMARNAGLTDIRLTPEPYSLDAMIQWNDLLYRTLIEELPAGKKLGDFVTSLAVSARAPRA